MSIIYCQCCEQPVDTDFKASYEVCEGCLDRANAAPGLLEALEKIEKGEGAFSMDPLKHCENCLEETKETARAAIAAAGETP